jgi:hypothetical protein
VGKPEGKRPLGTPRRRWVNNFKIYLRETESDGMDWMDLAHDRDQWSFSRRAQLHKYVSKFMDKTMLIL